MKIVTTASEEAFIEMLHCIRHEAGEWLSLHINMLPMQRQLLNQLGLSKKTLEKINAVGIDLAKLLASSDLNKFEGKIMVFSDNDIVTLFRKNFALPLNEILAGLKSQFDKNSVLHLLTIEEVSDKLPEFFALSKKKLETSANQQLKKRAVEIGENLGAFRGTDPELTQAIEHKRLTRPVGCILVIEDEAMIRGLISSMFKDDYDVIQAANATDGITAYIDNAPDVVFLDIHMSGLNGYDTLKYLKNIDTHAYVVMLSGDSSHRNVLSTLEQGSAGFICKPFSKAKLEEYVRKCPSLHPDARREALIRFRTNNSPKT